MTVFEEDGWPALIDDPLPPKPELDPRRRLRDTVKNLNRGQRPPGIRFVAHRNGTQVGWQPTA
jgi:hypothetical protein